MCLTLFEAAKDESRLKHLAALVLREGELICWLPFVTSPAVAC